MTAKSSFLPEPVRLPSGILAKIELIPMPEPDERGRYRPRQDCDIQVSLFRDDALIERRQWGTLICGEAVALSDGTVLSEDDLYDLDDLGWGQMMKYGVVPDAFIG